MSPNYNAPGLDRPKIKYILSVIDNPDKQPKVPPGHESEFVLKLIRLRDVPHENLLAVIGEAVEFIQSSMRNDDGGILVHCQKGISRSASVVIGFIMEEMNINLDTALRYVQSNRSKVKPNAGFQEQLILWWSLRYNVLDEEGKPKPEYIEWQKENAEKTKKLKN